MKIVLWKSTVDESPQFFVLECDCLRHYVSTTFPDQQIQKFLLKKCPECEAKFPKKMTDRICALNTLKDL